MTLSLVLVTVLLAVEVFGSYIYMKEVALD